jgi:hypothetical protein
MVDLSPSNTLAVIRGPDFHYLATRFASSEKTRYYLQGVAVQSVNQSGGNDPVLVATDGHVLGAIQPSKDQSLFLMPRPEGFILRADKNLLQACKPTKKSEFLIVCRPSAIEIYDCPNDPAISWLADADLKPSVIFGRELYIDGTFPDWRRVLPPPGVSEPVTVVSFNAEYLAKFSAADKDQIITLVTATDGNEGPFWVYNSDPRFLGVLMPRRTPKNFAAEEFATRYAAVMGKSVANANANAKKGKAV